MRIVNFFESDRQDHWLAELEKCDWSAGKFLHRLLSTGAFFEAVGEGSRVLLLTEGDDLISFCTYAEKDDIQPTDLSPWMGFIYTFPARRGHRYAGKLLAEAERLAKAEGADKIYISTNHVGLYEKYGCEYYAQMNDMDGQPSRVYVKKTGPAPQRELFVSFARRCAANRVYPLSVAEGIQSGEMLADDENGIRAVLFRHYAGFAYLSGEPDEAFLRRIDRAFFQKENERRFLLVTDDERVAAFFENRDGLLQDRRIEYRFASLLPEPPAADGFKIEPITEANIRRIRGRIVPSFSWADERQFLKNGFGFAALDGETVAAAAFSAAVSSEEVDIGVETDERYRRRGLAKLLADRMCREILARGKRPVWAHGAANAASRRTALGVGFEEARTNTVIRRRA